MLFTKGNWSGQAAKLHEDEVTSVVPWGGGGRDESVKNGATQKAAAGYQPMDTGGMAPAQFHMATLYSNIRRSLNRVSPSGSFVDHEPLGGKPKPRASIAWGAAGAFAAAADSRPNGGGGGGGGSSGSSQSGEETTTPTGSSGGDAAGDGTSDGGVGDGIAPMNQAREDCEAWLRAAVAVSTDDAAKLNVFVVSERSLPDATKVAEKMVKLMDDVAKDGGPPGHAGTPDETARALVGVAQAELL